MEMQKNSLKGSMEEGNYMQQYFGKSLIFSYFMPNIFSLELLSKRSLNFLWTSCMNPSNAFKFL